MKTAVIKDIVREIKRTFSRFFAIFMIVLLGISFFLGVLASPFYMQKSADTYFDEYHLQDLRLISTIGFTEDDLLEIQDMDMVSGASGIYTRDFLLLTDDMDTEQVVSVTSMPSDLSEYNDHYINRFRLFDGRLPENEHECLIRYSASKVQPINVGDILHLSTGTDEDILDVLTVNEVEVVGVTYSPSNISFDLGSSNIGNGHISFLAYLSEDAFLSEYYTEIAVTLDGAEDEDSFSKKYFEYVDDFEEDFILLSEERISVRMDEMKEKLYETVSSEVEKEVRKNVEEEIRKKATEEIENKTKDAVELAAKEKLSDTVKEEVEIRVHTELEKRVLSEVTKEVKNKIHEEAEKELRKEVHLRVEEEVQKAVHEEINFQNDLIRERINNSLNNAVSGNTDALFTYLQSRGLISDTWQENMDETINELTDATASYEVMLLMGSDSVKKRIDEETEKQVALHLEEAYQTAESMYLQKYVSENYPAALEMAEKEYLSGTVSEYYDKAYEEAYDEYYEEAYEKAYEEALPEALSENLEKAVSENLDTEVEKILPDIIEDTYKEEEEKLFSDLPEMEWFIFNRHFVSSFVEYDNAVSTMRTISILFPIFFLFVAALVCFTTMTRMVDEERMTIGTYKALGYDKKDIILKYVIYALLASLFGGVAGVFLGLKIYPTVIYNAWGIAYQLPPMVKADVTLLSMGSVLLMVFVVVLSAYLACIKDLSSDPSVLMRPKAPKEGKKMFLEYFPFWKKFSFTWKVTLRNIFRYKKRFIMTLLGVAGCTALLIIGFGLSDSIHHLIVTQYESIIKYNAVVTMQPDITKEEREDIKKFLSEDDEIESLIYVSSEMGNAYGSKDSDTNEIITIYAISDMDSLQDYLSVRDVNTLKPQELPKGGVLISKRLSDVLQVKKGDRILIENRNGIKKRVKVLGISEMYVGHFVFLSDNLYEKLFKEKASDNTAFIISTLSDEEEEYLGTKLMELDTVSSVSFIKNNVKNINSMMSALSLITVVLVIASGLLSFVVLYNLANVNISERLREVATIKVLGFYDREVYVYVYRELIAITIIGAILGMPLGILLHHTIMGAISISSIYFGHYISPLSYLYSFLLTAAFSLIVSLFIHKKLQKIPMVESLKSVE